MREQIVDSAEGGSLETEIQHQLLAGGFRSADRHSGLLFVGLTVHL